MIVEAPAVETSMKRRFQSEVLDHFQMSFRTLAAEASGETGMKALGGCDCDGIVQHGHGYTIQKPRHLT